MNSNSSKQIKPVSLKGTSGREKGEKRHSLSLTFAYQSASPLPSLEDQLFKPVAVSPAMTCPEMLASIRVSKLLETHLVKTKKSQPKQQQNHKDFASVH